MSYRKIVIGKDTWEYIVGKEGVKFRSPEGETSWVLKYRILGLTTDQFIRDVRANFDADDDYVELYQIKPSNIREYIENALMDTY